MGVYVWGVYVWGVYVWGVYVWGVYVWGVYVGCVRVLHVLYMYSCICSVSQVDSLVRIIIFY